MTSRGRRQGRSCGEPCVPSEVVGRTGAGHAVSHKGFAAALTRLDQFRRDRETGVAAVAISLVDAAAGTRPLLTTRSLARARTPVSRRCREAAWTQTRTWAAAFMNSLRTSAFSSGRRPAGRAAERRGSCAGRPVSWNVRGRTNPAARRRARDGRHRASPSVVQRVCSVLAKLPVDDGAGEVNCEAKHIGAERELARSKLSRVTHHSALHRLV